MKNLLLIAMLLITLSARSQSDSTTSVLALSKAVTYMRDNSLKFHDQYSIGSAMVIVSTIGYGASMFIPAEISTDADHHKVYTKRDTGLIISGAVAIIGGMITIDAFKHIGRNGKWKFKGDGIVMEF